MAKVKDDPDVPVLVRGDERMTYGAVMDVVKLVYKCKVKNMALVTVEK
jgi:biopolymer transport protein ExbD